MEDVLTCCFTGHRLIKSAELPRLREQLESTLRKLIARGYSVFISGGALGFDQLAAQIVLNLRQEFPHIRLHMVLPCKDQSLHWSAAQKTDYERILAECDEICYIAEQYSAGCMHKRNRAMVKGASCVVAYLHRNSGGTHYTVKLAQKQGIEVLNLSQPHSTCKQISFGEILQPCK